MSGHPRALSVAVVTGGHPYDVPAFTRLMTDLGSIGISTSVLDLDEFVAAPRGTVAGYDCVLFYFFPLVGPPDEDDALRPGARAVLEGLLDSGQGIVVLHHALLAYPHWDTWDGVVGASGRDRFTYHGERRLTVEVADDHHEITRGLRGWEMTDETYRMPEPEGTPLLRVDHPDSMRVIAWCRRFRSSRVFCLQSGHDSSTWNKRDFQQVLAHGIAWTAGGPVAAGGRAHDGRTSLAE